MSELDPQAAQPPQGPEAQNPVVRIRAQYIKDLSFENPGSAAVQVQPNIDLGIDVGATQYNGTDGLYEVSLRFSAEAKAGDKVLFILELDYAGIFQFETTDQMLAEQVLLIECPRMLFPFARRVVADISRDGGFPPLMIDPVDFVALYQQQKARQGAQAGDIGNALAQGGPVGA